MTIYDFYRRVAEILSPKHTDELFDYIIHSMDDDGGFLRSRYCYWEKTLDDHPFAERKYAVLALTRPFDFDNSTEYYDSNSNTLLKLQLTYYDLAAEDVEEEILWNASMGYRYPIVINLEAGTCEVRDMVELYI